MIFGLGKKNKGTKLEFEIDGMHCTSCSMSIDGALEDIEGITCSSTSYAKQKCAVEYDPQKVTVSQIHDTVKKLGYKIK